MGTINEIQKEILDNITQSADLPAIQILTQDEQQSAGNASQTSKVGIVRLLVYVFALCVWAQRQLWSVFEKELEKKIRASKPFTRGWYIQESLKYQHGYNLNQNNVYDTPTNPQDAEVIEESKIIAKAAIEQAVIQGVGALRIKLAKFESNDLVALDQNELDGFQSYITQIGAAGVFVEAFSSDADDLKLVCNIYYNPLVLNSSGERLDGNDDTPVQNAIEEFLKSLDFNGVLSLVSLVDEIQKVEGVVDPFIINAASKFGNFQYTSQNNSNTVGPFTEFRRPDSGYMKLDLEESEFNFIPSQNV